MFKPIMLSVILLIGLLNVNADNYYLNGKINGLSGECIVLQEFYGDQSKVIDSALTDATGKFSFDLGSKKAPGQLRLIFSERRFLDLIFNKENILFSTTLDHLLDDMTIEESFENQIYYQYIRFRAKSQKRIGELRKQLYSYDSTSTFYRALKTEYTQTVKQEEDFILQLLANYPDALASAFIRIDREPYPDVSWDSDRANRWAFSHYPDHFVFSDTSLLRSNAISAKIISYLSVALSIENDPDSLESLFRQASFHLLASTGKDSVMFQFIRNYLINGFKTLGYDSLSLFLSEIPYPCCPCEKTEKKIQASPNRTKSFSRKIVVKDEAGAAKKIILRKNPWKIFIATTNCEWSNRILNVLLDTKHQGFEAQKMTLILLKEGEQPIPGYDPALFHYVSEKHLQALYQATGKAQRPLLVYFDEAGNITGVFTSWLDFF